MAIKSVYIADMIVKDDVISIRDEEHRGPDTESRPDADLKIVEQYAAHDIRTHVEHARRY